MKNTSSVRSCLCGVGGHEHALPPERAASMAAEASAAQESKAAQHAESARVAAQNKAAKQAAKVQNAGTKAARTAERLQLGKALLAGAYKMANFELGDVAAERKRRSTCRVCWWRSGTP